MQARMKNVATLVPAALQAMHALDKSTKDLGIPAKAFGLIHLRVSQINGCGVCLDMHTRELVHAGEKNERIFTIAAWREAPYFSAAERAALALTEAVTRLADRADPVPDAIWSEAAKHFDERALSALLLAIGVINVWNRLNVSVHQVAGQWRG